MSLTLANVQLDIPADGYDDVVSFWAGALSATPRAVDGTYTHLDGAAAELGVHLQRRPAGESPGVHLDLLADGADDAEAEVARLTGLGAAEQWRGETGTVLSDPAGLLFCVVADDRRERLATRDPRRAYLDAVVLDVPPTVQEAAAAFWAQALRVAQFVPNAPDSPYLWSDGLRSTAGALDLGVQRRGDAGPARVHLDTISNDVAGEVARLTALGAEVEAELPRWTVLADPAGNLLCVVDASQGPVADATGSDGAAAAPDDEET